MDGDGNNKHDNDFVRAADFFGTFRCRRIRLHRGVPPLPPPPPPPGQNGGVDANLSVRFR